MASSQKPNPNGPAIGDAEILVDRPKTQRRRSDHEHRHGQAHAAFAPMRTPLLATGISPHTGTTDSHLWCSAESSTASQTAWVASASRNVGAVGFPASRFSRKSAAWCTNVCS